MFLTLALDCVCSALWPWRKNPGKDWIGGRGSPRAGLDAVEKILGRESNCGRPGRILLVTFPDLRRRERLIEPTKMLITSLGNLLPGFLKFDVSSCKALSSR